MNPIDTSCSHSDPKPGTDNPEADFILCGAQKGERCNWLQADGTLLATDEVHPERKEDAGAMTGEAADTVPAAAFDADVARRLFP